MQRLILWDVDGTLLTTGGVAAESMRTAMREVIGPIAPTERTSYAGKTDWQIILEAFPELTPEAARVHLEEFARFYAGELRRRHAELAARSHALAGVSAVLARLDGQVRQAPLTGNIAAVAQIKLEVVGLAPYLNLAAGAYGDDHHRRIHLVAIAAERARQVYAREFSPHEIVVVGDTPHDIECGWHNGARTVAVATGPYTLDDLAAHQPDALLPDLNDTDKVVAAILGL